MARQRAVKSSSDANVYGCGNLQNENILTLVSSFLPALRLAKLYCYLPWR